MPPSSQLTLRSLHRPGSQLRALTESQEEDLALAGLIRRKVAVEIPCGTHAEKNRSRSGTRAQQSLQEVT